MCLHHGRQGEMASKPECVANWWRRWKWIWRQFGFINCCICCEVLINWWKSPFFWRPNHWVTRQNALWILFGACEGTSKMACQETPISAGFGNPPGAEMIYLAWWHGEVALVPCSNFPEVPVSHCSNPGFGRRFVLLTGKGSKNLPTWIPTFFF